MGWEAYLWLYLRLCRAGRRAHSIIMISSCHQNPGHALPWGRGLGASLFSTCCPNAVASCVPQVRLSQDGAAIAAMISCEGEAVDLARPVAITDSVEAWLGGLTQVGGGGGGRGPNHATLAVPGQWHASGKLVAVAFGSMHLRNTEYNKLPSRR